MSSDQRPQSSLMNIEQVAERLGVSVRHVRRLVFEHRIPFVKWGHLLRFRPEALASWLDANEVPASREYRL